MDSDLTTQDGVRSYLTQHLSLDVDPNGVSRLGGGYCNFAWRVKLNAPYQGHESIILKHAQAHLSSDQTVEIGVERLAYEYQALKTVYGSSVVNENESWVSVPEGLHYDPDRHVLLMQDVGSLQTLMDFVCAKPPPSTDIATLIGSQIGEFIARLHNLGRENKDQSKFQYFSGNTAGRQAAGTIYQTITPNAATYGIEDPILPIVAKELGEESLRSEETLIMGDFWMSNILLQFGENSSDLKKIWIIDWEMCRYGASAVDVASLAGDCFLIARFQDQSVGTKLRQAYLQNYARIAKVPIGYGRVTTGIGAHLIMWTAMLEWGSDEGTREYVEKGVKALREARKDSQDGEITSILVKESLSR